MYGVSVFCPHGQGVVVIKQGAEGKTFAAVFSKSTLMRWLVMDESFYANGDKGRGVTAVWDTPVGVDGNFWVCSRLV